MMLNARNRRQQQPRTQTDRRNRFNWVLMLAIMIGTWASVTIVHSLSSCRDYGRDALLPFALHLAASTNTPTSSTRTSIRTWENVSQALQSRLERLEKGAKEAESARSRLEQQVQELEIHRQQQNDEQEQHKLRRNTRKSKNKPQRTSERKQERPGTCGAAQVRVEPTDLSSFVAADATGKSKTRPPWCLDVPVPPNQTKFYLGMIIHARVYPEDKPQLTKRDLAHWLTYHRYAGVERVYLFDTYVDQKEQLLLDPHIQKAIESGFVVYTDYHEVATAAKLTNANHLTKVQAPAYKVGQALAVESTRWCGFIDMDEYPYVPSDTAPGFFARWLRNKEESERDQQECRKTTQYKMPNFMVEGGREKYDNETKKAPMLIQQIPRLHKKVANNLVKQIVRLDAAREHNIHSSTLLYGQTKNASGDDIMMKHFWGGRNFGWRRVDQLEESERKALLNITVENDMGQIPKQVLRCF